MQRHQKARLASNHKASRATNQTVQTNRLCSRLQTLNRFTHLWNINEYICNHGFQSFSHYTPPNCIFFELKGSRWEGKKIQGLGGSHKSSFRQNGHKHSLHEIAACINSCVPKQRSIQCIACSKEQVHHISMSRQKTMWWLR